MKCFRLVLALAVFLSSPHFVVAQNHEPVIESGSEVHAMDVVILGDSNTWIGGDDCDNPKGWNKWFVDIFKPLSCKSYARSGATWTNTVSTKPNMEENIAVLGNDNVIYNQILRLSAACKEGRQPVPHLIIIAAGTNDAWFVKKRPGVFSKTVGQAFSGGSLLNRKPSQVLSLAESVRYGCEMLESLFPQAQIILLAPLQAIQPTEANLAKACEVIEQCGLRMGLKVIRQDRECCIRRVDEMKTKRYTTDGAHTSEEGARLNGTYLAKRIAELTQP
ncbi:MAG: SGNH/GDSL hydrolase family protein [Prevotella sp.]|nr:SGNH/GDSL hydrolase family protein [Prevotella sp.]